ncbi:hypothetical protein JZ751_019800, partial [Albula glossodonta]
MAAFCTRREKEGGGGNAIHYFPEKGQRETRFGELRHKKQRQQAEVLDQLQRPHPAPLPIIHLDSLLSHHGD